uniref:Epidermal patterning factor-like protein n=1 Tax=Cicer arietinum TaxID=3827 RepID=A0A1S3EHT9_CICAR|nr:EPIDERMAL PATTERNING FACTOR-like protein 4 [Cicer arietinum]
MFMNKIHVYFVVSFFFLAIFTTIFSPITASRNINIPQEAIGQRTVSQDKSEVSVVTSRSLLDGLGSHPPSCIGKCGTCTPCEPILVTIPPVSAPTMSAPLRTIVMIEYYPQAWRCTCGGKLYPPLF